VWYKLTRNTASNFFGALAPLAIGFFLMPLIVNRIGAAAYGVWLLANSVVGYMGIIDLGLGPTVTKKTAEYLAVDARAGLNRMLSTAFALYTVLGVVMCVAVLGLGFIAPSIFQTDPGQAPQFQLIVWLIGLQAAAGFPFSIFGGALQGLQDFHIRNVITVLNAVLRLIGTVVVLTLGFGLVSLLLLEFALSAVSWTLQFAWVKKRIPSLRLRYSLYDAVEMKQLFRFSGAMLLWRVAGLTVHRANRIIIAFFLPVSNITLFEIGTKTADTPRTGLTSFLSPLLPASSQLNAQSEAASMREVYLTGTKFTLAFCLAGVSVLFFWGPEFINLWMGNQFAAAVPIMYILLLGNLYQAQNVVAHVMMAGMGALKAFTRVMAAYPIVNLVLSVILVQVFGLTGVAWAMTITFIVLETYLMTQVLRLFKVSFLDLLRSCYIPPLKALAPAAFVAWSLDRVITVSSWDRLVGVVAVFGIVYCATFWVFGISKDQKRKLLSTVAAMVKRPAARAEQA
jgi:O-antigen/teichoic acid export membrane protein